MRDDTPAIEIRPADLAKNAEAFSECLTVLPRTISTVLDIRYGLGGWANVGKQHYPARKWYGMEADPATFEAAWKFEGDEILNVRFDGTLPRFWPGRFDLVCADFNNLTMLKAKPLFELLDSAASNFLIFTDVACSKLHLNFRSYGLDRPNLDEYLLRFEQRLLGWSLVHSARSHHHAVTTAWRRK